MSDSISLIEDLRMKVTEHSMATQAWPLHATAELPRSQKGTLFLRRLQARPGAKFKNRCLTFDSMCDIETPAPGHGGLSRTMARASLDDRATQTHAHDHRTAS